MIILVFGKMYVYRFYHPSRTDMKVQQIQLALVNETIIGMTTVVICAVLPRIENVYVHCRSVNFHL